MPKFQRGDQVEMTDEAKRWNKAARSFTGTVVGYSVQYPDQVKVRRDGLVTIEMWNEEAWRLRNTPSEDLAYPLPLPTSSRS